VTSVLKARSFDAEGVDAIGGVWEHHKLPQHDPGRAPAKIEFCTI